ncbi:hypothetical protein D9757_002379 [Collybiopsis confluens]|uniref:Mediator of RNA polymerase II transcription subunit 19 n=1 Tax=Collybiopsis confluens TaxID=2823264 RepID=A0A8H5MF48_9AGAR|nr:hypothetical protein D9757_002379 [Collybiopsis confluens]
MDSTNTNAVAGPSNLRNSSPHPDSPSRHIAVPDSHFEPISLFLPPTEGHPPFPAYIQSTQDLLGQFHLHEAYDTYVRPFVNTPQDPAAANAIATSPTTSGANGAGVDKGKGKEIVPPSIAQTPAQDAQDPDDDEGGKGEKKKKNSYKHLIKGVPGKHSMKKDDYLTTLIQVPPKQRVRISEFDSRTQRDAFTVSLEGLKGWNPSALVLASAQAREDKKKRRELKRLAKAQITAQSQAPTQQSSPAASTPIQAPVPTSAASSSFSPSAPTPARPSAVSSTPKPTGTPTPRTHPSAATAAPTATRPNSTKPGLPPVQIPPPGLRVSTPLRTATPTGPHPLSAPPLSASSIAPPTSAPNIAPTTPRGKKRERDETPLLPLA